MKTVIKGNCTLFTYEQTRIYLIGALKNRGIVNVANDLTKQGFEVFADWMCPGPDADTYLLEYAKNRGWSYKQALQSFAARNAFEFDKVHIDRAHAVVLVMPAGKSAHLELGYARGTGKPGFILFDQEPERFDVMYQFATDVFFNQAELIEALRKI